MAHGDIERFHSRSCAERGADDLVPIAQRRPPPPLNGHGRMLTD